MPENIQLECKHNSNANHSGRHIISNDTNSTNNQQKNGPDPYSLNYSSTSSNTVANENKIVDSHISLSQITEVFDDTNSSTPHSQPTINEPPPHSGDKTSSSSLSSTNDSADTINSIINDEVGIDGEMKFSYVKAIAEAIIETPHKEILLNDLYNKIIVKYPELKNKRVDWQNGIRHNLSLNECFVKLDRNPSGKGHYWGIRRSNLEAFLKNDFRRRWNQSRSRCKRSRYNRHDEYNFRMEDGSMQDYFGGNYIENDPPFPGYYNYNNRYHQHRLHPYHTITPPPFQLQYIPAMNNNYFVENYSHECEQLYNQLYNRPTHMDAPNPLWPIHSQPLHYPPPYFQSHPDTHFQHPSPIHCSHHLKNNIPYCVDENDQLEGWETSNERIRPRDKIIIRSAELLTDSDSARDPKSSSLTGSNSSPIPLPLVNNASQKCPSKSIIRSYFKNKNAFNTRNEGRASVATRIECDNEEDVTSSKFDLNSLLDR